MAKKKLRRLVSLERWAELSVKTGEFSGIFDAYAWLAKQLGLRNLSSVKQWAYGVRAVDAAHVLKLEKLTRGAVPCHMSRPDLYPPERFAQRKPGKRARAN